MITTLLPQTHHQLHSDRLSVRNKESQRLKPARTPRSTLTVGEPQCPPPAHSTKEISSPFLRLERGTRSSRNSSTTICPFPQPLGRLETPTSRLLVKALRSLNLVLTRRVAGCAPFHSAPIGRTQMDLGPWSLRFRSTDQQQS